MIREKFEKPGRRHLRKGILKRHRHDDEAVYFHKFITKAYGNNTNEEHALLEFLNGDLRIVNIENGNFRFCSDKEFIDCIPDETLSIAINNSNKESLEDKIYTVKQLLNHTPDLKDIPKFEELGIGRWHEGVVSSWNWNIKALLLEKGYFLDKILLDIELSQMYQEK